MSIARSGTVSTGGVRHGMGYSCGRGEAYSGRVGQVW